jgi:hypothetical protein
MPPFEPTDRLEGEVADLKEEVSGIREDVTGLGKVQAEHEVRFGNGREVMAEMKAEISALKPKAPDWVKMLGVLAGLFAATLGAHYWLIEQFNDRPTDLQVEKAFHEHSTTGHIETQRDINVIRDTQTEQRVILNGLETTVSKQGEKLDLILERLPAHR